MDNSNEKVGSQNRLIHKSFRKAQTIDFLTRISNIALPLPERVDKFDKKCYNRMNLIYSGYAFWDSSPTQIIVNKSTALKEIHL